MLRGVYAHLGGVVFILTRRKHLANTADILWRHRYRLCEPAHWLCEHEYWLCEHERQPGAGRRAGGEPAP